LSSFDPDIVRQLGSALPEFVVGYLVDGSWPRWPPARRFASLGARAVHPHESLVTARFMRSLERRGALVNVYGVNEEARALELHALGVDAIITDVPRRIAEALTARAGVR
jgi:glycerophosphoryl diester phosphodiesterase